MYHEKNHNIYSSERIDLEVFFKLYTTNDISVAAFLMMKGISIKNAYINAAGVYVFEFEDADGNARLYSLEFLNSCCSRYDNQMRNLRKVLKNS